MYQIELTKTAQKELLSYRNEVQKKLESVIDSLENNPRPVGCKKLKGRENTWRIRIGDYRILYSIDDKLKNITIFRIQHRKDIYQ